MTTAHKILIWLARLIASVTIVFLSFFIISEGGLEIFITQGQFYIEGILFVAFLFFSATSTIIAFWRIKIGAYLLLLSGLILAIFTFIIAIQNNLLVAIIIGGPFIMSSILLYLTTIKKRSKAIMNIS
jgi:hypothetical protein